MPGPWLHAGDDDGPYYVEVDASPPHPPLTARDLEEDARDMAAEDGDYDQCEPTL